jgi:GTP cyclohydrolase I
LLKIIRMKQKEILLKIQPEKELHIHEMGEEHIASSAETSLRPDAFSQDDELKIELIEKHFREIMYIMGLDLTDDSLAGTPQRVAKMYVKEIFSGLNPANKPVARLFENKYQYNQMLVEKDITFYSNSGAGGNPQLLGAPALIQASIF